jgi:putative oxidoreductase
LLLRLVVGAPLVLDAIHGRTVVPHAPSIAAHIVAAGVGLSLLAGIWTPVAGTLQVAIELWMLASRIGPDGLPLVLAAVGASVVMLGPGAWSIDARLFGRKRIDLEMP